MLFSSYRYFSEFLRRESMDRRLLVLLARPQHRRGETRLVRRIGEVLGLQTEAVVLDVDLAALAGDRGVEQIAVVELDARLGGVDFHHPSTGRVIHPGHRAQLADVAVAHEVVVVTGIAVDAAETLADRVWRGEVERCLSHRSRLTSRYQRL